MQIKLNVEFEVALGAIKNDVTRGGERGYPKLGIKSDIGWMGYMQIVALPLKKICISLKRSCVVDE